MMDDISEQTELANEISEAISSSVGFQDVDEVLYNRLILIYSADLLATASTTPKL